MTARTFEETYIKYPFAPLVRLGMRIAAFLIAANTRRKADIDLHTGTPHSA